MFKVVQPPPPKKPNYQSQEPVSMPPDMVKGLGRYDSVKDLQMGRVSGLSGSPTVGILGLYEGSQGQHQP